MKKINRKGFTLIELLAVIVIMAIILVVTIPTILSSISDARISSLHNLARTAAKNYVNIEVADLIAIDKQLASTGMTVNENWQCINTPLAKILGIPVDDVAISEQTRYYEHQGCLKWVFGDDGNTFYEKEIHPDETCSAIRKVGNSVEVFLVASQNGRYNIADQFVYALSSQQTGGKTPAWTL